MSRRLQKFVGAFLSAALLTACSGGNGFSPSAPLSVGQSLLGRHGSHHVKKAAGWMETVLHAFAGGSDGANPQAALTNVNGTLYGTTYSGGANGYGTIFAIGTSGAKTVLYSFAGGSDGANPQAALTNVNGTLYGTTFSGGDTDCGTVFAITTSGTKTALYSFHCSVFGRQEDGSNPETGLINVNGTLYGTTSSGGYYDDGTVFSITTSGVYNKLHEFRGAYSCGPRGRNTCYDGAFPALGTLANVGGTLYGTTMGGGTCSNGTVFSITTSGSEAVLYSFCTAVNGLQPAAGMVNLNGTLYGTTETGGTSGDGTVFTITTSGAESVLYSFAGGTDGKTPKADLLNVNGTIYGTTSGGGPSNGGTVFKVTTSGAETVLYGFAGGTDGDLPLGSLASINGALYGTTTQGGGAGCGSAGCGTVFSITPPPAETVLHSFGGSADGSNPYAPLVDVNGTLYGTTRSGGTSGRGTVFTITPYGTETLLHNFGGGSGDGYEPYAPLVDVNGTLYSTTHSGGTSGGGTVYSITSYGTETTLYAFRGSPDSQSPYAGLATLHGRLYGTTPQGGAYNAGTVYSITPFGTESVVQSFYAGSDGQTPYAGLINVGRNLYGTTEAGGVYNGGTLFAITKSGKETVLHNFGQSGDGANPMAALLDVSGTVYGTTESGGAYGGGIVFAISESTGAEIVLHNFGGSGDGSNPFAGLVMLNGTLYGTTSSGGANNQGTIYSITPTPSGTYAVVWAFGGPLDGTQPRADLIVVNGTLYGTTVTGGAYNQGTVFSWSAPSFLRRHR
jgi:uncharacterized repeat protein (TIGR03803 family)